MSKSSIRVMTYNIHKGIGGVDRRYDLQRIIDVILQYEPNILMLQEVDSGVKRSKYDKQVEILSETLDLPHVVFQKNVKVKNGHYGNATLSQFPLEDHHDLDLTVSIKKRRKALMVRTHLPVGNHSRTLFLCNTHLGLAGFERTIQIKKILASKKLHRLHHDTPTIAGGDFNDVWYSIGRKLMFPAGFQCAVKRTKTFPAALAMRSLDAIYYRGDLELDHSFAGHTKLARQASDHLPVIADFVVYSK